ncbi:MAG: M1 family metallopeptidase [Lewinellaceae bacterium]|nr:M1 family metallopeptidase [Lewinellaceae bacterium]
MPRFFLLLMFFAAGQLNGQAPYFQQEVHYHIQVTLDDSLHVLHGQTSFAYINHSPDTLSTLYIHLWPNAFNERTSAFSEQLLRQGNDQFYFAPENERGRIDSLDFRVNSLPIEWEYTLQHRDIARIWLPTPLAPSDSVRIETPFRVKIPASFSRLGHVGQSYQLTQWYPKPAVYDRQGWHHMPYLDQGEYYSEFGSFVVDITLPENYRVAATGTLQNPTEQQWLANIANQAFTEVLSDAATAPFPASSRSFKTIRYTARQVHDFAWFADKRFHVSCDTTTLPSGRKVTTWAFFTALQADLWAHATDYIDRALQYYSLRVGEYPYPQATAVQSALSAGAGMEYPMITVIGLANSGQALDEVITHELGHNWFYGILASNERDHPWLDEGLNSFYDHAYSRIHYQANAWNKLPQIVQGRSRMDVGQLGYLYQARLHRDQSPETTSDSLSEMNYLLTAYEKPAQALRLLESYWGTPRFDLAMQAYYREWSFKHPYPQDLRESLEQSSGESLPWLFDGLLASTRKQDYQLRKVRQLASEVLEVSLRNGGTLAAPLLLQGLQKEKVIFTTWVPGFVGDTVVRIPHGPYTTLVIDDDRVTPELYRHNNNWHFHRLFPRLESWSVSILPRVVDDEHPQLFITPALGWNVYDRWMPGVILSNTSIPVRPIEFELMPLWSSRNRRLVGTGEVRFSRYQDRGWVRGVTLGIAGRRFHEQVNENLHYRLRYTQLRPFLQFDLAAAPQGTFRHTLTAESIFLNSQQPRFGNDGTLAGIDTQHATFQVLRYAWENTRVLHPLGGALQLEQNTLPVFNRQESFLKISLEWRQAFTYAPGRHFRWRLFGGTFLGKSSDALNLLPNAWNLAAQGFNDYQHRELYWGRNETQGIYSRQIYRREGGMHLAFAAPYRLGRSNSFILALNTSLDLPILPKAITKFPFQLYADVGYTGGTPNLPGSNLDDPLLWTMGLSLNFFDRRLEIALPLLNAANIRATWADQGLNFWERFVFTVDLLRLNPIPFSKEVRL